MSRLITWRRPEVKFGRNLVKKKQHKKYQDENKKSAMNKKKKFLVKAGLPLKLLVDSRIAQRGHEKSMAWAGSR